MNKITTEKIIKILSTEKNHKNLTSKLQQKKIIKILLTEKNLTQYEKIWWLGILHSIVYME